MNYELHFYSEPDAHHIVKSPDNPPQLTYGTIRAGDGGTIIAALNNDNMWEVPGVGAFSDVVICAA